MNLSHFGHCQIQAEPIDPATIRKSLNVHNTVGGLAIFEGIVRNVNHGKKVKHLNYECYEVLALKEMNRIATEAKGRFDLNYSYQIHRVGHLDIGDIAVFIAALSKHRNEAFLACRYVIDELKVRVPIWKKEYYEDESSEWTRCHEHPGRAL